MLHGNSICKSLESQLNQAQTQLCNQFLIQPSECIVATMQWLEEKHPEIIKGYADVSRGIFSAEDEEAMHKYYKSDYELAVAGLMLSGIVVGFSLDTGKVSLYTASHHIIETLCAEGLLDNGRGELPSNYERVVGSLSVATPFLSKSAFESFYAIRLEPKVYGSTIKFNTVIQRSGLCLRRTVLMPYVCYSSCMMLLNKFLETRILEVKQVTKTRFVTRDIEVLSKVYGRGRAYSLLGYKPLPQIGNFYLPSLGASIRTAGVTNVILTDIESIRIAQLSEVDLSDVNTDLSNARDFFRYTVRRMKGQQIKDLAYKLELSNLISFDESELGDLASIKKKIYDSSLYDSQYYNFMKENQDMFNMDKYRTLKCKFGNLSEPVPVPQTLEELREMLKTGVYRIIVSKVDGKLSVITATENKKMLTGLYGRDYMAKYESLGVCLRTAKYLLERHNGDTIDFDDVVELDKKYGLNLNMERIFSSHLVDGVMPETVSVSSVLAGVNELLANSGSREAREQSYLTVRSCNATYSGQGKSRNFYKQLKLETIISITKLKDCR